MMRSHSMLCVLTIFACASASSLAASQPARINAEMSPIRKVITLIEEMKSTCDKEAEEDTAAYEKYSCWCKNTEKEKTEAIETAEQRIADLDTFLEEGAAKAGELKTQIAGLEDDIADDKAALADATAIREKEHDAFVAEEADMKETRFLLAGAIKTLSKVQLLQAQKTRGDSEVRLAESEAQAALVQVSERVQRKHRNFRSTMQKDLFDMLGSFEDAKQLRGAVFQQSDAEFRSTTLLPWEKSEEQKGMDAKPNDLVGAAAGAKSYNARSGKILGILSEMADEFTRDLAASQKAELEALTAFQELNAAKLAEIAEATKLKEEKEGELANLLDKIAKAKEDKAATQAAMEADKEFLASMLEQCQTEDDEYAKRSKVRSEEITALTETLKILTEDQARDLYEKTISFVQVGSTRMGMAQRLASQDRAKELVMKRLGEVAKKHGNWALASIAVSARLDSFGKVKVVLDKMLAELKEQQKEEYAKWETCKASIDKTEDKIKVEENTKKDLAEKHLGLTNTINTLKDEIATLKNEVAEMQVSLKQAGEQRKAQNELFQQSVSDQRATINILQKALTRLREFYGFAQVHAHGVAAAAPPPKPSSKSYEKSGLSGGVVQMLMKIIEDATSVEAELQVSEQHDQASYATYVKQTTSSIEADRALTEEKEGHLASTEAERSETEEAQLANEQELSTLGELLKAHHLDCDYILKYFDIRQTARAEEMGAITDAKAILSGADYGK